MRRDIGAEFARSQVIVEHGYVDLIEQPFGLLHRARRLRQIAVFAQNRRPQQQVIRMIVEQEHANGSARLGACVREESWSIRWHKSIFDAKNGDFCEPRLMCFFYLLLRFDFTDFAAPGMNSAAARSHWRMSNAGDPPSFFPLEYPRATRPAQSS